MNNAQLALLLRNYLVRLQEVRHDLRRGLDEIEGIEYQQIPQRKWVGAGDEPTWALLPSQEDYETILVDDPNNPVLLLNLDHFINSLEGDIDRLLGEG